MKNRAFITVVMICLALAGCGQTSAQQGPYEEENVSANKITTGVLKAISSFSAKHSTKGSHLPSGCVSGQTTITLENTDDFPSSGNGWIISSLNDRNAFSWTGKTSTTLTGCSGVDNHGPGSLVIPAAKVIFIDNDVNEMRFFGDQGDGDIEELACIGVKADGGDNFIIDIGSINSGMSLIPLRAQSYSRIAIVGYSIQEYGIWAGGGKGPIQLFPSASASAPSHSANKGTLWVTSAGVLYINTNGGTTWQKVGAQ